MIKSHVKTASMEKDKMLESLKIIILNFFFYCRNFNNKDISIVIRILF